MPNFALIPGSETTVGPLVGKVDGWPSYTVRLETTTGGNPVEKSGTSASVRTVDHATARGETLLLEGFVSDFSGGRRPAEAWAEIRRLHKAVQPVKCITEHGSYDNLLITRAEAPVTSRGLRFTLELSEIQTVSITDNELPAEQLDGPAVGRSGVVERGRVALPPM